jgi:hypothetical protein
MQAQLARFDLTRRQAQPPLRFDAFEQGMQEPYALRTCTLRFTLLS